MSCMKRKKDYPEFMKWTHEIPVTKNSKERPFEDIKKDRNKVVQRIDKDLVCPMNWLQECLDKIQGVKKNKMIDTIKYLNKPTKRANQQQVPIIRKIIEDYDSYTRFCMSYDDEEIGVIHYNEKTEETLEKLKKISISKDTMYRLIATSLGYNGKVHTDKLYKKATKYTQKMLTLLYKYDKNKFLNCFIH